MIDLLDKHFDTAFDAPDGIKKLRELILTLAMQGKLVEQDPNDQPASELLKEIEAEKKRLVKEKKIKAPKELLPIKDDEKPYELPKGWEWVRLGNISNYNTRPNLTGDDINSETWVLDLEDIEKETSRLLYKAKFSERLSKSSKSTFLKGDVLYSKLRPYLDKVIVADDDGVCTTEIVPITPLGGIVPEFLRWLLKRPFFLGYVNSLMYGVKMPRLGTDDAVNSIHPLPPLAEQHRIVARIDQLMARCDELEKLREQRNAKRIAVHTSAINSLLTAQDTPSFDSAWDFITRSFADLYTVKENVKELRKTILQLAVMGKLVEQDPSDQPASELLKEIEAEKKRLVKEKKIKAPKELLPIKDDEKPYQLPKGWEWIRLGGISQINGGFAFKSSAYVNEGVRIIRISDFDEQGFKNDKIVRYDFSEKLNEYLLEENNILMAMTGGTVGKSLFVNTLPEKMVVNQRVATIKIWSGILPSFINSLIQTNLIQSVIQNAKNSTNDNISMADITGFFVPLPPLAEQHRIVARIDQLMARCDDLERLIDRSDNQKTRLLNAVMAEV